MAGRRAGQARGRGAPLSLVVAGALVAALTVAPLAYLLVRATEAADPIGLLLSRPTLRALGATLSLAAAVTAVTLVLGVGTAWLVERTDLPGRRVLGVLAVTPLVVPTYVGALALVAAFGSGGLAAEFGWVIGFWGALVALALSTYPYVLLVARSALADVDPATEEAARALGDGSFAVFVRVTLPQLRAAATTGGLLVFLYVLSDFGAVGIVRYDTLTRAIFTEYRAFDRARPAVLGIVLVGVTLLAIVLERRLRGRAAPTAARAGRRQAPLVRLGRWRWPAAGVVVLLAVTALGIPLGVLGYWAVAGSTRGEGVAGLARAVTASVGLSGAAGVAAVALALPVAVLAARFPRRSSRVIESLSVAGFALPGLVVALALVALAARSLPWLYQTLPLVVVAYVVRFLPEALGSVRAAVQRVDPALEEAARSLGSSPLEVARTTTLPLVTGGMVAGGALVFLTAMKELPATLLLRPAGTDTLAVLVWQGASNGRYAEAAPAALVLVAVSAVGLALLPGARARTRARSRTRARNAGPASGTAASTAAPTTPAEVQVAAPVVPGAW